MPKVHTPKPTTTTIALVETSTIIGSVANSNGLFTQQLADRIDSYGTPLSELTVFQLIDLINKQRTAFNKKPPRKLTSRFNVLDKAKNTIATFVPFDVAMQYKEQSTCTIKYAGLEVQP